MEINTANKPRCALAILLTVSSHQCSFATFFQKYRRLTFSCRRRKPLKTGGDTKLLLHKCSEQGHKLEMDLFCNDCNYWIANCDKKEETRNSHRFFCNQLRNCIHHKQRSAVYTEREWSTGTLAPFLHSFGMLSLERAELDMILTSGAQLSYFSMWKLGGR